MGKAAISITLDVDNLTWLRGRVGAGGHRSVSDLLDQMVTAARQRGDVAGARSVVGSIDIDAADPMLAGADAYVQDIFQRSVARPIALGETAPKYRASTSRASKRRG